MVDSSAKALTRRCAGQQQQQLADDLRARLGLILTTACSRKEHIPPVDSLCGEKYSRPRFGRVGLGVVGRVRHLQDQLCEDGAGDGLMSSSVDVKSRPPDGRKISRGKFQAYQREKYAKRAKSTMVSLACVRWSSIPK